MSLLCPNEVDQCSLIGGKARALYSLAETGLPIPPWAALPSDTPIPESVSLASLGPGPYAVRSSAIEEDGAKQSFAGQFDSFLFVAESEVREKITSVRHSSQSDHLDIYRGTKEDQQPSTPGVLIQQMITPAVSGVAFSADPVSGERRVAVISAVWGVGSGLVSGECDADTWRVDPDGTILSESIAEKTTAHQPDPNHPEGASSKLVPQDQQNIPCLTGTQIKEITTFVHRCAAHFGCPQDIEWAIDDSGKLWLLQSRPITTLAELPDPGDPLTVWDNSNIAESYSGVTTPLTFSFAHRVYEHVYREFCRLLRVSEERIEASDTTFKRMLGLVRGRVYYNLVSWYRVLALLPGFQLNRSFMEQMMGVKEPLPDEIVDQIVQENQRSPRKDRQDLLRTAFGLFSSHRRLPRDIRFFYQRLEEALEPPAKSWSELTSSELIAHYHRLESSLLRKWDAPLVNDFFAMIYYGTLKSLCQKWAGDTDGTLQNELLLDTGDIISAEPPRRIRRMAQLVAQDKTLAKTLATAESTVTEKLAALRKNPALHELYQSYLTDFGDRCLEELKLESATVTDSPGPLLTSIGNFALSGRAQVDPVPNANTSSEKDVRDRIKNPLKQIIFGWALRKTRDRVRDRENLRFERTRLFGRVRTIMRELGQRLAADHRLESPDDIFYLEVTEILALHDGTASTMNLKQLVASRREEFNDFRTSPPPPDRFETRGPLYRHSTFTSQEKEADLTGDERQGIGACAGLVRGTVRVVTNPREATLQPGEILVAQQTDPGWVILFPSAAGLLVERGSLLSHSAIVSREMNLPCIVSLTHITSWLQTGDRIEMNGQTGMVRKLSDEE